MSLYWGIYSFQSWPVILFVDVNQALNEIPKASEKLPPPPKKKKLSRQDQSDVKRTAEIYRCLLCCWKTCNEQLSSRLVKFMMMTTVNKLLTITINTIRYFLSRATIVTNYDLETNRHKYQVVLLDAWENLILIGSFALMNIDDCQSCVSKDNY